MKAPHRCNDSERAPACFSSFSTLFSSTTLYTWRVLHNDMTKVKCSSRTLSSGCRVSSDVAVGGRRSFRSWGRGVGRRCVTGRVRRPAIRLDRTVVARNRVCCSTCRVGACGTSWVRRSTWSSWVRGDSTCGIGSTTGG